MHNITNIKARKKDIH